MLHVIHRHAINERSLTQFSIRAMEAATYVIRVVLFSAYDLSLHPGLQSSKSISAGLQFQ